MHTLDVFVCAITLLAAPSVTHQPLPHFSHVCSPGAATVADSVSRTRFSTSAVCVYGDSQHWMFQPAVPSFLSSTFYLLQTSNR